MTVSNTFFKLSLDSRKGAKASLKHHKLILRKKSLRLFLLSFLSLSRACCLSPPFPWQLSFDLASVRDLAPDTVSKALRRLAVVVCVLRRVRVLLSAVVHRRDGMSRQDRVVAGVPHQSVVVGSLQTCMPGRSVCALTMMKSRGC